MTRSPGVAIKCTEEQPLIQRKGASHQENPESRFSSYEAFVKSMREEARTGTSRPFSTQAGEVGSAAAAAHRFKSEFSSAACWALSGCWTRRTPGMPRGYSE